MLFSGHLHRWRPITPRDPSHIHPRLVPPIAPRPRGRPVAVAAVVGVAPAIRGARATVAAAAAATRVVAAAALVVAGARPSTGSPQ